MTTPLELAAEALRDAGALRSLNQRSLDIFRRIVECYLATGEPAGVAQPIAPAAHPAVAGLHPQRDAGAWRKAG